MTVQPELQHDSLPVGGSLALLQIPFVFTQDNLLNTDEFLRKAKERGYNVSLEGLQRLHSRRLLLPLYRVSDTPVAGRRLNVEPDRGGSVRRWVFDAAADGRLRDPAEEGYSVAWPYTRPEGDLARGWRNGFVYSSWQLLELGNAISEYAFTKYPWWHARPERMARDRRQILALAALSPCYLSGVIGRMSIPIGTDEDRLWRYRSEADVLELLRLAGVDPVDLRKEAESLLLHTQDDPMHRWVKLLRYARYDGWSKMTGRPLDCMWHRVAAEILLRAHEDLAAAGHLEPLPDMAGATWHGPHHDRLTARYPEAETLERALAEFGLSPHPRVILLLEGETEQRHVPRLLAELGLTQPQEVRVQPCRSSKVNAHLIARYGITPRIGRRLGNCWLLDASPTALVVAMDPENNFATPEMCADERRKLQQAIREEVRYQDADISQDDLNILVSMHVWGDDKYELANFTDDELVPAIAQLAAAHGVEGTDSSAWELELRTYLQHARRLHLDIEAPLGRIKAPKDKIALADILWPVLRTKCEQELAADTVETPVLRVAMEVKRLVAKLTPVFALEVPEGFTAEE